MIRLWVAALACWGAAHTAQAGAIATVEERLVARFNERGAHVMARAISAERSPIKGLWEVKLDDGNSVFTDEKAIHVIAGSLIELRAEEGALPRESAWAQAAYLSVGDPEAARKAAVIIDTAACSEKCRRQTLSLLSARQTRVHILLTASGARPVPEGLLCARDRAGALKSWGLDEALSQARRRPCDVKNQSAEKLTARFAHQPKPMWIPLAGPAAREPGLDLSAEPAGEPGKGIGAKK